MKIKAILWSLAAMSMLGSCSNDDVLTSNEGENYGEEAIYAATVKLVLPTVSASHTRAEEPEFNDGKDIEYTVDNSKVYFEFFDNDKNRMEIVSGQDITWQDDATSTNITKTGTVTLKANRKPVYMVVFVNADTEVYNDICTLSMKALKAPITPTGDTKEAIADHIANKSGFVMTNSSYYDGGGKPVQEVKVDEYIYKIGSEGEKKAVVVNVERVVAKATVAVTATSAGTSSSEPYYTIGGEGDQVMYGVKFLGWCLNATNKTMIPLKKIPESVWNHSNEVVWNSSKNGRSYWAEDGNYSSGEGKYLDNSGFEDGKQTINGGEASLALNYYSLNQIGNEVATNLDAENIATEYCFENTGISELYNTYGAVTHVLLKAKYVDKSGNEVAGDVFRLNKVIYTEDEMKKWVIEKLKVPFPEISFTNDDIEFERISTNYQNRADVKGTVKYVGQAELTGFNKDNLNSFLFGEATLWVYPQGLCYYSVPIKHFEQVGKTTTGYYGVVRNHWYQIEVSKVLGFGHPADPDKPIVPEDIEDDEWALQCDIHVLAWAKKKQDATVGGDNIWQ